MTPIQLPETRYARSGNVSIAYQVMGDGPVDLIMVPGLLSHIEFFHELPGYTDFHAPPCRIRARDKLRQARPGLV